MEIEEYKKIFDFIEKQLVCSMQDYATKRRRLKLPLIPPKIFSSLLTDVYNIFSSESSLLDVTGDFVIVGSLYGHAINLLQILSKYGSPARQKYLFLGNLIGYGEFSIEVILIVYLMKALFPNNIYIIRGDSEFSKSCISNGFKNELDMKYDNCNLFPHFMKSFSMIPFAAVINRKAFCVSGGIGKAVIDLDVIKNIRRPVIAIVDQAIMELLVSDPTDVLPMFLPASRGEGNLFGAEACNQFLRETKLTIIVRGRQIVPSGFEPKFNNQLISVCSADGMEKDNKSGILLFGPILNRGESFDCLPQIKRTEINYIASISDEKWEVQKTSSFNDTPTNLLTSDYYSKNSGLRLSTLTVGTANINPNINRKALRNTNSLKTPAQQGYNPTLRLGRQRSSQTNPTSKIIATRQILRF